MKTWPGDRQRSETANKLLIIGSGFTGLCIAQALKADNILYDQVDASDDIGGNWYHGVYETAHIISSKKITQFSHFPMPEDYPDFPSAQNMRDYLNAFADRFQLRQHIELNCKVTYVRPVEDNLWEVTFANGEQRIYKGVLMCNGHHWCKRFPKFEGEFSGQIIHSKDYKRPEQLRGKKVLVIGAGNSACDLAAEAARVGAKCVMSMRESVWFIPKTFAGIPVPDLIQWWMPEWLQKLIIHGAIRFSFGQHSDYGMPEPQHKLFEKHPTINNEVPYYIKHGRIQVKPSVKRLNGSTVEFSDGSQEDIDLIVCATGYKVAYPFLPPELQRVEGVVVKCYCSCFLADYKGLYFMAWSQGRGGIGSLLSEFMPFFISLLQLEDRIQIPVGLVFQEMGQKLPQTHISDGQKVFRQLKLANILFKLIEKKALAIDAKYPNFVNRPLPRVPDSKQSQSLVVY